MRYGIIIIKNGSYEEYRSNNEDEMRCPPTKQILTAPSQDGVGAVQIITGERHMTTTEKTLAWCLALSVSANALILIMAMRYASSSLNLIIDKVLT